MTLEPWPEVPIGDFAREVTDQPIGDVEVLSVTKHRGFVPSLEYFGKQVFSKDISRYKLVSKGQFAYATIHLDEGSIDALEIREHGAISPMYTVFDVDGSRVDRRFLLELLRSNGMLRRYQEIGQGTVNRRKSIAFATLARERIPLPPLAEQKKIAAILSSVDEAIRANDAVIEQTRRVKEGLLQELLTRGIGHTEFRETEIGPLPVGWEVHSLESACGAVIDYRGKSPPKSDSGVPLLTAKNIRTGYIDEEPREYIPEEEWETWMSRGLPREGDVMFTTEAPLGKVAPHPGGRVAVAQRVMTFRGNERLLNRFLFWQLLAPPFQRRVQTNATGSTALGIKGRTLRSMPIAVPPIDEQLQVSRKLDALHESELAQRAATGRLSLLKSGLLQDLLTGKVRVTP